MSEPRDPLRSLFREAGDFGQARSAADPVSSITERGTRAQRRRMAVVAMGVCLVVGGGGAVAVGLLPLRPEPVAPATGPSPGYPSPTPSGRLPQERSSPPTPDSTLPGGATTLGTRGAGDDRPTGPASTATSTPTSVSTSASGAPPPPKSTSPPLSTSPPTPTETTDGAASRP
ncbi:hypothetical protein [Streptomyces sp. NPDC091649]|uniref:hypothetical protein n=1 Tax=Streptomyces sp. NPDC091649 TaxID=3366004 RepID=UPI0038237CBE